MTDQALRGGMAHRGLEGRRKEDLADKRVEQRHTAVLRGLWPCNAEGEPVGAVLGKEVPPPVARGAGQSSATALAGVTLVSGQKSRKRQLC